MRKHSKRKLNINHLFLLVILLPIYVAATPVIFTNSFEAPKGSIEFTSNESVLFTQVGDVANFQVIVRDYQGNIISDGNIIWTLSSTSNLDISNPQLRTVDVISNSFSVNTVTLTAYHSGTNSTGTANIMLAEISANSRLIKDDDVISGSTPLSGELSTVVLHNNPRTSVIQEGDYMLSEQETGLVDRT